VIFVTRQRLIHEVAFVTSRQILDVFAGCIRADEQGDAFAEIFEHVKTGIQSFELKANPKVWRADPGAN
jgi:hypothetical protein